MQTWLAVAKSKDFHCYSCLVKKIDDKYFFRVQYSSKTNNIKPS